MFELVPSWTWTWVAMVGPPSLYFFLPLRDTIIAFTDGEFNHGD